MEHSTSITSIARHSSPAERLSFGKVLRDTVPRSTHGNWNQSADRPDPIAALEASSQGRLPNLVPIRYGRMLKSPFTFLRGAAIVMAADLATTPTTGIKVQACGDCHLLNFGGYGTPEGNLYADQNERDRQALVAAVKSGRIKAIESEN